MSRVHVAKPVATHEIFCLGLKSKTKNHFSFQNENTDSRVDTILYSDVSMCVCISTKAFLSTNVKHEKRKDELTDWARACSI